MTASESPSTRSTLRTFVLIAAVVALLLTAVSALSPAGGRAQATPTGAAPGPTGAAAVPTDSLWAATINASASLNACASPASAQSLSSCFQAPLSYGSGSLTAVATDGVNVYFAGLTVGFGLSCPVSGLGANCTKIAAGPWPSSKNQVNALAAADGYLYIGQDNGLIYRCPVDQPFDAQNPGSVPSQCEQFENAGSRSVHSLLVANNTLYAGLSYYATGTEQKKKGLLWSCPLTEANACTTLDSYGKTYANSLAAGDGYLWVGLNNGTLLRCDTQAANACRTWQSAGSGVVSVSYDGNSTLYAATKSSGVLECPTTTSGCSALIPSVRGGTVAAGAGSAFSSNGSASAPLRYGATSSYSQAPLGYWGYASLIYLPADGPIGVGGVTVAVKGLKRLKRSCDSYGPGPILRVRLTRPNGPALTRRTLLCRAVGATATAKAVYVPISDLLDGGRYRVTARAAGLSARAPVTVSKDRTTTVRLRLSGGRG